MMSVQELNSSRPKSYLRLIRFVWDRENQRDTIDFAPGFNLLGDRTQIERTIILRLIRYAMGGSHSRIDDTVMHATKEVSVEFLANERRVITVRRFKHPTGKFSVTVDSEPSHALSPREMGEFILDLLEIPKVRYQRGQQKPLLSFNELARSFVIDRDFSYAEMLAKMYPEPRTETVKVMLGLTTQEIADVEERIKETEGEIEQLTKQIQGIERLLSDFRVGSLIEIEERRGNLRELLNEVQRDEDTVRRHIEKLATHESVEEAHRAEEYQTLREELIAKRERLGNVESELTVLARQVQEKSDLKALLESEVGRLERHTASQYVLSTFTFSRCPRCLQSIDSTMRVREQREICMLCGRPFQLDTEYDKDAWSKALRDANKAVQEADQLLAHYSSRTESLERERIELQERTAWLQNELMRQTASYVSPLVEELSLINERRAQLLKALSELDLEEKQRRYVIRMHDEELPELRRNRDRLRGRLQELEMKRGRPGERTEALLTHFRSFMRRTASGQYRSASWDEVEMLPKVNDQEHTRALTGFDLAISVLGFHYALLAMKVRPPSFETSHPGLLIVDEPQQQMMEPHQYQSIMRLLVELANEYQEEVQVVVAATDVGGFEDYLRPIILIREDSLR
jgi:predicted  nucleic acid-binding Zn-ribbon protein